MTLDIMIDEQLLEINAELRKENEQLRVEKEMFKKDSDIYFNKWRETIDDLRLTEKQRDINYKHESEIRHNYDVIVDKYMMIKREYDDLLSRYHDLKRENETLRDMVKLGDFIDD